VFVVVLAIGSGLFIPSGGTLFREKLQYLFPALILASATLPKCVYRFMDHFCSKEASQASYEQAINS
jgi:hypothetical protein